MKNNQKRRWFGVVLLLATLFLTLGHTILSPSVAFASDRAHKDEVPHAPDSEDHSPCPTELHQTVINRTTSNDDSSHTLGDFGHCTFGTHSSDFAYPKHNSITSHTFDQENIPPRLPLEQKTQLLF